MSQPDIETLMELINAMDRDELTQQLTSFDATFPIDFSPEFLAQQSEDKLRHVLAAICMHCDRLPDIETVNS